MDIDKNQWAEVWMRFRSGDRDAFGEIYEEFVDVLFAYGRKITSDRELVKDAVQDIFLNLYKYNPQLHQPEFLEFYLFRSLRNEIIHKIKKNKQESSLTDDGMFLFDLKFNAEQDSFDKESDELRVKALKEILQTVDTQKRELLFLKFSTGLSYIQIGQILNINPDTAKKQVYRTLDQLRDRFGKQLLELLMIWCKE
ncbi:MAG TPA: hypothetical protein DHV48_14945 [Prolixibacteraceae bacterium]|nr:MAG: hypothetical protein A2066_09555 [Bacteroidetes bacterium GWB2_41_8]HCY42628.1 hypothetical protein [Prolixibacteraceae bacterium]